MGQADHLPLLELADRAAWRAWLTTNGETSPGVWLVIGKKGNAVTQLTYEDAVEEAVAQGWIDSTARRLDENRFRQLFTPRKRGSAWSRSNKQRVKKLLAEGRMQPSGLAAVEAAKADGSWALLDDVEDIVVPEDLAAAFDANGEARRRFEALADSQRKLFLWWIASARRPETRAKRVQETVRLAERGLTIEDRER